MTDTPTMFIDGGARGNPGPAAYAVVIARPGEPVVEEADTIGRASNNVAEYTALVRGLRLAAELGLTRLDVFSDSELLVKQMSGQYRVKHADLVPLHKEATRARGGFEAVTITHVRRERNARADALCNEALDGKPRKPGAAAIDAPGPSPKRRGEAEVLPSPLGGEGRGAARGARGSTAPVTPAGGPGGESRSPHPQPLSPKGRGEKTGPSATVSDAPVLADALAVLESAALVWASTGLAGLPPAMVWEQLWSVLDEGGVLKKKKVK